MHGLQGVPKAGSSMMPAPAEGERFRDDSPEEREFKYTCASEPRIRTTPRPPRAWPPASRVPGRPAEEGPRRALGESQRGCETRLWGCGVVVTVAGR